MVYLNKRLDRAKERIRKQEYRSLEISAAQKDKEKGNMVENLTDIEDQIQKVKHVFQTSSEEQG